MIKHLFLIILRNFNRSKSTFFINLIGLSTGLACALLIYLWVNDELNIDKFFKNDNRLYQVIENNYQENGIITNDGTSGLLAETLEKDFPEIEYAAQVTPAKWFAEVDGFNIFYDNKKLNAAGQFVGKDFFNVFSFKLSEGNADEVLTDINSIVISKSLAKRIFGNSENVIGKTLEWQILKFKSIVKITGVFEDMPRNSSSHVDFVLSFEKFKEINPSVVRWGNYGTNAYILLRKNADPKLLNKKIANIIEEKSGDDFRKLFLRRYSDAYLYGKYENGVQSGGRIEYVKLFSLIAVFILFIACINFMNLSTAKASVRMKEIGVKKTIGASRKMLIVQYLSESIFMSFIAMILAIIFTKLMIPEFNSITGKDLSLTLNYVNLSPLLFITLITGIIAGSYPALYLSNLSPILILKGKMKISTSELIIRKWLVVFQFTLSVILIVSVLVVYKQIEYVQNKNLGYSKENLIQFANEGKVSENTDTFISEVKKIPGVINAATSQQSIMGIQSTTVGLDWEGKNPSSVVPFINFTAGYGMIETLGLDVIAGRNFSKDFGTDEQNIILNETAVKTMGLKNAVGKYINLWGVNRQIIGVVKDFNIETLHEKIKPLFIKLPDHYLNFIIVRIKPGMERETIKSLENLYNDFNPGFKLNYTFLDHDYQLLYTLEERISILSRYFAGIAILISCLGLFGLTAFTSQRRFKEIGIRKILGSSEFGIIYMLSSDFTKLVLFSIIIALPLSYLLIKNWLDGFAYRIELNVWYFLSAGMLTLVIAWFTVASQAFKAARVNPVKCLRDE